MKENNKNTEKLISRTKIYLVIIAVLLILLGILKPKFIPYEVVFYVILLFYTMWSKNQRKAEIGSELQELTLNINNAAKSTLINSPFPLIIAETNNNIIWKSEEFVNKFEGKDFNINDYVEVLLKEIKIGIEKEDNSKNGKGSIDTNLTIEKNHYHILGSYIKSKSEDEKYTCIIYFINDTEYQENKKKLADTKVDLGIITIDNYEEISQRLSAQISPLLIAQIEKKIYDWAEKYDGFIIKSDRDKFVCIIEEANLKKATEDKITLLEEVKNIDIPDTIKPTLSIAFSNDGDKINEKALSAKAVTDIALGRGGDQAIIKIDGRYEFFGGRSKETEKRTKVKARMAAHALKEIINESENVIIMGHINSDMDSIGSSLGIYRLAKTLGKDAKIVNETSGLGIENFLDEAKKQKEYEEIFVSTESVINEITEDTLVVVCDTNKKSYVASPRILEKAEKIVVIDHHRRATDYIENTILTFHEVYASSAAELVTEILEYSGVDIKLTEIEMESLYAGIMLDTKNFTFKTGVRTFEAAAYLRKKGVDIIKVKKWFQDDLETYEKVSYIVSKAEIVNDKIAISIYDKEDDNANIIAAKAADELLTIAGITASFVLGKIGEKVYISGRSIGDINVQIILEKLGGGGHITLAGAQLENATLEEAKEKLVGIINDYLTE